LPRTRSEARRDSGQARREPLPRHADPSCRNQPRQAVTKSSFANRYTGAHAPTWTPRLVAAQARRVAMSTVTKQEQGQVEKANTAGKTPVVFVHGLWLLPSSWDRWAKHFEKAGFAALTPGWPDDPDTV